MTNDGSNTLVYDGESQLVSSTSGSGSGSYTFDGHGLRVKKVSSSTTTVTIFSASQVVAEYLNGAAPSSPTNEYIYSGSQKIAAIQSGTTYYLHNDHLSLRVRTDTSGNVADQRGHYPFGETWYSPSGTPFVFASYYRDNESGNDYALARTYVNRLGRFSSPDRVSGSTGDPQSLNRYAYSLNDPVNLFDPSGMDPCISVVAKHKKWLERLEIAGLGPSASAFDSDFLGQDFPDGGGCDLLGGGGGSSDPPLDGGGNASPCMRNGVPTICATAPGSMPPDVPPGTGSSAPDLGNPYYDDPSNDPSQYFGPFHITPGGGGGGKIALKVTDDCFDKKTGTRKIKYQLINSPLGAYNYMVAEHLSDPSLDPSQERSGFTDDLRPGYFAKVGSTVTNTQQFYVYPVNSPTQTQWVPIIPQPGGDPIKLNTIQMTKGATPAQNIIKVNGKLAPDCK
jgi:RHS repeat-associated protein